MRRVENNGLMILEWYLCTGTAVIIIAAPMQVNGGDVAVILKCMWDMDRSQLVPAVSYCHTVTCLPVVRLPSCTQSSYTNNATCRLPPI